MDEKLLSRVMRVSEKTGDRVIVVSPQTQRAFAVLPFEAYEGMVEGRASLVDLGSETVEEMSRNELVDKINHDIAIWNSAQQREKEEGDGVQMDIIEEEEQEEQYYLEPIE